MRNVKGTINRVELLGWLGNDPDLRFIPNGTAVCTFDVATKRVSGRNEDGEREYSTDWITVKCWERLAEQCNTYLHRGRRVMITGSLRNETWEDRETGRLRSRTYVRAVDVMFLDPRPEQIVETVEDEAEPPEQTEDIPF